MCLKGGGEVVAYAGTLKPTTKRRRLLAVAVAVVGLVVCWPRFPRWQIRSSRIRGVRVLRRPQLELELEVVLEQTNWVPLELVADAPFAVQMNGPLGTGAIKRRRLTRPLTTLELSLQVPTRASVGREFVVQMGAHRRFLDLDVRTTVLVRACYFIYMEVAVKCAHRVAHTFRGPFIQRARCHYTLLDLPVLRWISTITDEWSDDYYTSH